MASDVIRADLDVLSAAASKLSSVASQLQTISKDLSGMYIPRIAGGKLRVSGGTVSSVVHGYGRTASNVGNRVSTLSGNVKHVTSFFEQTEEELSRGDTAIHGSPDAAAAQAAKEQRQTQATWFKIGVSALCIIGTVAATIASGGTFAVVVAAGVTTGAVTGFTNNAADQYVEKGFNDFDWLDAGKDAVIGGIVGGTTSAVGYGVGSTVTNSVKNVVLANAGEKAAQSIVTNTAIGAGSQMISGASSRAAGEMVHDVLTEGRIDIGDAWNAATDANAVLTDAVMGGASGAYTGYRETKAANEYPKSLNPDIPPEYIKDGRFDWKAAGLDGDNCAVNGEWNQTTLKDGTIIDRYGNPTGSFAGKDGTPFDQRGLPNVEDKYAYHRYKVVNKNGIDTEMSVVKSIPGMDNGGGTQYRFRYSEPMKVINPDGGVTLKYEEISISDLIKNGDIVEIFRNNTITDGSYTMRRNGNE